MFFEEEKSTTNITFEVDKKRATVFEYFLESLDMTPAEAFDEMLGVLASKVGNKSGSKESKPFELKSEEKKLSEEVVVSRIKKWAGDKNSYPRIMIQAYINASQILNEDFAWRVKMELYFMSRTGDSNNNRFLNIFRQMSSASSRAYGDIFIKDRNKDNVYLNEKYKELVYSLKDQFLE